MSYKFNPCRPCCQCTDKPHGFIDTTSLYYDKLMIDSGGTYFLPKYEDYLAPEHPNLFHISGDFDIFKCYSKNDTSGIFQIEFPGTVEKAYLYYYIECPINLTIYTTNSTIPYYDVVESGYGMSLGVMYQEVDYSELNTQHRLIPTGVYQLSKDVTLTFGSNTQHVNNRYCRLTAIPQPKVKQRLLNGYVWSNYAEGFDYWYEVGESGEYRSNIVTVVFKSDITNFVKSNGNGEYVINNLPATVNPYELKRQYSGLEFDYPGISGNNLGANLLVIYKNGNKFKHIHLQDGLMTSEYQNNTDSYFGNKIVKQVVLNDFLKVDPDRFYMISGVPEIISTGEMIDVGPDKFYNPIWVPVSSGIYQFVPIPYNSDFWNQTSYWKDWLHLEKIYNTIPLANPTPSSVKIAYVNLLGGDKFYRHDRSILTNQEFELYTFNVQHKTYSSLVLMDSGVNRFYRHELSPSSAFSPNELLSQNSISGIDFANCTELCANIDFSYLKRVNESLYSILNPTSFPPFIYCGIDNLDGFPILISGVPSETEMTYDETETPTAMQYNYLTGNVRVSGLMPETYPVILCSSYETE